MYEVSANVWMYATNSNIGTSNIGMFILALQTLPIAMAITMADVWSADVWIMHNSNIGTIQTLAAELKTSAAEGHRGKSFQVAELPTNMYNYTLPFNLLVEIFCSVTKLW